MKDQKTEDKNPTVALNMIVKEDESVVMLERCIDSIKKYVDSAFITVTYKKKPPTADNPVVKLLTKYNVNVSYFKWVYSFADARNFAMKQIPKKYMYFFWMDADDVIHNGEKLKGVIQDAYLHNHASVFFNYWYAVDLDENGDVKEVVIEHKRERLVKNDNTFKWVGALHETLIGQKQQNVVQVFRGDCIIVHLSTPKRHEDNTDRNVEILEQSLKKQKGKDPRTLMYLAKAYADRGKAGKEAKQREKDTARAEKLFEGYLFGTGQPGEKDYRESSGWAEERSSAWEYLSEIYRLKGQNNKAIKAIVNAMVEDPKFPNYYLQLSLIYSGMKNWDKAEHWLNVALHMEFPKTSLILNPRDLKTRSLEIAYHVALNKGKLEEAEKAAEKLFKILPKIKTLEERLETIKKLKHDNKLAQSVVYLGRHLEDSGQQAKIQGLVKAVPRELRHEQFYSQMRNRFLPPKVWGKKEIAILCGKGWEKWSPKNTEQGIGGSEEAVICLSRELARLGYKVTVYGDPQDDAGVYEGVEYRNWHDMNIKDSFNILILWRAVGFADNPFNAKQTYLWMHDVPSNADYTEERISKIDKVMPLSEYHKSLLMMYKGGEFVPFPDDKVVISNNGILKMNVNKKWKRDPHRMIWTSSYDRGLTYFLMMWPEIKKAVPDATLDVYYGWQTYDAIHKGNPARAQWKAQMIKMMDQPGVKEHGRINHNQIKKEMATSGVFAYPTDFQEISCISAMKAQALGAIPVTTNYAALKETVRHGVKVDVDITEKSGRKEYAKELIAMLKDTKRQDEIRKVMMPAAQEEFLWENVAKQWETMFKKNTSSMVKL